MATQKIVVSLVGAGVLLMPEDVDTGIAVVPPVGLEEPPTVVKLPVAHALVKFPALERTRQ